MVSEVQLVVQVAMGAVFLLSTVGKLCDPTTFARGVADYKILPSSLAYPLALFLIPLEGWLSVAHLTGWLLTPSALAGVGMLVSFGVATTVNVARGRVIPCHCFGGNSGEMVSGRTLVRLLLLLAGEILLVFGRKLFWEQPLSLRSMLGTSDFGLTLLWALLLLAAGGWILRLGELRVLFRSCGTCREATKLARGKTDRGLRSYLGAG